VNDWCFDSDLLIFLNDLKGNNKREWFHDNKKRYEAIYKKPAAAFGQIVEAELENRTGLKHRSKTYRINRDIRFSKDKTPYNCHLHISFTPEGRSEASPSWFFGLGVDRLSLGVGTFGFDKERLETYRSRVAGQDGERFNDIADKLKQTGVRFNDPDLKRVPKLFDQEHPRANWLKYKGLSCWIDDDQPEVLWKNGCPSHVADRFIKVKPLFDWLMEF
jgi:uncharacterized protein (TIGR02453 family)